MIPSQRLTIRMVHKSTTPELFKAICLWMVPASIQRCEQWTGVAKTLLTGWLFDIQDHSTVAAIYTWFKAIYKDPLLANQYNGMSQGFLNTHTHIYIYRAWWESSHRRLGYTELENTSQFWREFVHLYIFFSDRHWKRNLYMIHIAYRCWPKGFSVKIQAKWIANSQIGLTQSWFLVGAQRVTCSGSNVCHR